MTGSDFRALKNAPLGIRNNNPLNLRPSYRNGKPEQWQGMTGINNNFMQFSNTVFGWRAAAIDIIGDIRKGKNTLNKLISEFAPVTENNTENYIRIVSGLTGFQPNQVLKTDEETLFRLMKAKFQVENGSKWVEYAKDNEIKAGIYFALNRKKTFTPGKPIKPSSGEITTTLLILFIFLVVVYRTFIS